MIYFKSFLFSLLYVSTANSFPSFTPTNTIFCTADIFSSDLKIPKIGLLPFSFSLNPSEQQHVWKKTIYKIELIDSYKAYYSSYMISSADSAKESWPSFPQKIIKKYSPIENGNIDFTLTRFAEFEQRTSGMSLEFNTPRGFYGAFLLDKEKDGAIKKILAPIKMDNDVAILAIDCIIMD